MNGDAAKTPAHIAIDMPTQNGSVSLPKTRFGSPSFLVSQTWNSGSLSQWKISSDLIQQMIVAAGSVILYTAVIVKRTVAGGILEGLSALWDRDILAFFLIGCTMFGVGLLGEYVGRIYQQVRDRPRYVIRAVLERDGDDADAAAARDNVRAMR